MRTEPTIANQSSTAPRRARHARATRPAEPAGLHRLGEAEPALERPGEERREQGRVPADSLRPEAAPAQSLDQPAAVALEGRDQARRERDREHRPAREAGALHEPVVVEHERVDGEGEHHRAEPQCLHDPVAQLLGRDVERAEHRDRRPAPEHVDPDRLDERRDHDERDARDEHAEQVETAPRARRAECDDEQAGGDHGHGERPVREQRGGGESRQERRCRPRAHDRPS